MQAAISLLLIACIVLLPTVARRWAADPEPATIERPGPGAEKPDRVGYFAPPTADNGVEQKVGRNILLGAILTVNRQSACRLSARQVQQIEDILHTPQSARVPHPGVLGRLAHERLTPPQLDVIWQMRDQPQLNFPNMVDRIGDPVWQATLKVVAKVAETSVDDVSLPTAYPSPEVKRRARTPFDTDVARGLYRLAYEEPPLALTHDQAVALLPTIKGYTWADRFEGIQKQRIMKTLNPQQQAAVRAQLKRAVIGPDDPLPASPVPLNNVSDEQFLKRIHRP